MTDKSNQIMELNIDNIFFNTRYTIPIYQRNYAWKYEQIEQLMNDIVDFKISDDVKEYFLGNLIVDRIAPNCYSVIDGQQRLTTIFLILSYLNHSSVNKTSLLFESRETSNITLTKIVEGDFISDEFTSVELISGYKFISQYFDTKKQNFGDDYENFLEEFKEKLHSIKLLRVQVPKDIDLNHYFEIMNTRGEQLELHEVAKARILKVFSDKKEKEVAASIWDACSKMDTYIQVNVSKKLRYLLFGDYDQTDHSQGWNKLEPSDFKGIFNTINERDLGESSIDTFTLQDILDNKEVKKIPNNFDNLEQERFTSIIDFPNFLLQVNATISNNTTNDESLDDKYFMKTLENNWKDEESAKRFIYALLENRFKFDKFIIKRDRQRDLDGDGKWSLKHLYLYRQDGKKSKDASQYKNTFEVDDKNKQITILQASMRITFTSPKVMHWITEILQIPLADLNDTKIIDVLEKYCIDKISDYREYIGFGVPRILFTYLDYILWRDTYPGINKNWDIIYRTSIEHFHPQNPADGSQDWNESDLHCFGNLALINVESNSKFSNLSPSSKNDTYKDVALQSPKLQMMVNIVKENKGEWKKEDAKSLQEDLYRVLDKEVNRLKPKSVE